MSLNDLAPAKLFRISKRWLSEHREMLELFPETKSLIPRLEEVHNGLFLLSQNSGLVSPEVLAVRDVQVRVDLRHDVLLRVGYRYLTILADLSEEPNEQAVLLSLRDYLFPGGLGMVNGAYDEEAGAAEMLEKNLTPERQTQLKEYQLKPGYSLLELVKDYIAKGKELGNLEDQKNKLLKDTGPSRLELHQARFAWIRVARALEANLKLATSDEKILAEVLEDLLAADKISSPKKEKATEADTKPSDETPSKD